MDKPPAFQLYAADFTMDTDSWTNEEIGVYFRLLMSEWVNGPLPNDPQRLASIARCSAQKFRANWKKVNKKFIQNSETSLINLRLEKTREKQEEFRNKLIESGRRGGLKAQRNRRVALSDPLSKASSEVPSENEALQSSVFNKAFTSYEVKAGETTPPDSLEEKPEDTPFSVGDPKKGHFEPALQARDNGTLQKILKACECFKGNKAFNPFQFIQRNKNRHPKALLLVLERLASTLARGTPIGAPWPYAEKILRVESKNFKEAEAIAAHKRLMDELKRLYPREPVVREDDG